MKYPWQIKITKIEMYKKYVLSKITYIVGKSAYSIKNILT